LPGKFIEGNRFAFSRISGFLRMDMEIFAPKAVLFDLDGTIADTLPMCIRAFREAIEPLSGKQLSDADIVATFGPSEEGTVISLLANVALRDEGTRRYLQRYEALHWMCPNPFPGVRELLEELRLQGVFVGMITGKGAKSAAITLRRFALEEFFTVVKCGSPDGAVKERRIEEVFAEFPQLVRERTLYVGDSPSDILACRKCGVKIAAAAWAAGTDAAALRALEPDFLFENVVELVTFLSRG
jgi:phosphoglycolate phosphatase/pyrophosphatase PpaX